MAVMKDLYLRLDQLEERTAATDGRTCHLREQVQELRASTEQRFCAVLEAQARQDDQLRRLARQLQLMLTPADEDHAPSVGGVLDLQARGAAARKLVALLAEVGGGQ